MSFRLIFSDESLFLNTFEPGTFEQNVPTGNSNNSNSQLTALPANQASENTNSVSTQTSIDNLTSQIAAPAEAKIEILIADEKNDQTPQKVEIPISKETADNLQTAIANAQEKPNETIIPTAETNNQIVNESLIKPSPFVPQYSISDSSFTIIRGNEKTSDSITYSFEKLLSDNFDGSGIKDKNESSLLSRFIDFAKSVIKVVQPRFEYEYGVDDMRKDKTEKAAQQKINQRIQEKLTNTQKPSQDELRRTENNKLMRKNEVSQNDKKQKEKSQQNLQKLRINEEILKSLLRK